MARGNQSERNEEVSHESENVVTTAEEITVEAQVEDVKEEIAPVAMEVTIAPASGEDLVSFLPSVSGVATIGKVQYAYTAGKECKLPDMVAGILSNSKKGHKK